ncbi:MAG: isochorismatase family protein [Chloroflexi bacterium]|nr:isochorismatase family protein [Chloroflexota bacterium]
MRPWQAIVPAEDRDLYTRTGLGARRSFGARPALLIVDVIESWTGSRPMDRDAAVEEYKTACGPSAWEALPNIRTLLDACREANVPIVMTRGDVEDKPFVGDSTKREKSADEARRIAAAPIPEIIAPREGEYVLCKAKASAFFGTTLPTYLVQRGVDTLIVAGTSTSGCVRATVTDAQSYGYTVFLVEECTFDRSDFLHLANLFDINAKYADVITLDEALAAISQHVADACAAAGVSA